MAQLAVRRLYADLSTLQEGDLDAFVDDIETLLNLTKLNDDNFTNAGITASSKVQAQAITETKIQNSAITTVNIINSAVTTAKLGAAVTTAKILDDNVTTAKIADSAVITSKINAAAVTTAKIADSAVTAVKHAVYAYSEGSSSGASGVTTATAVCTVTITSTGRPIFIGLTSDGSGNPAYVGIEANTFAGDVIIQHAVMEIKRTTSSVDTTLAMPAITKWSTPNDWAYNITSFGRVRYTPLLSTIKIPPGYFWTIDAPAAGVHTFTFTMRPYYSAHGAPYSGYTAGSPTCRTYYCKAIAYEL